MVYHSLSFSLSVSLSHNATLLDPMVRDETIVAQMDAISKDIARNSPLVSNPVPVGTLCEEYSDNKEFLSKITVSFQFFYL